MKKPLTPEQVWIRQRMRATLQSARAIRLYNGMSDANELFWRQMRVANQFRAAA